MQGLYTVIAKGKSYKDLSFLDALSQLQKSFEASPNKALEVQMFRQPSR